MWAEGGRARQAPCPSACTIWIPDLLTSLQLPAVLYRPTLRAGRKGYVAEDGESASFPTAPPYNRLTTPNPPTPTGRKGFVAKDEDGEQAVYKQRGGDGPQKDINMRVRVAGWRGALEG